MWDHFIRKLVFYKFVSYNYSGVTIIRNTKFLAQTGKFKIGFCTQDSRLHINYKFLLPMSASVEDFLPLVQGAAVMVVHNVVFFFQAFSAFFRYWVKNSGPFNKIPINIKIGSKIVALRFLLIRYFYHNLPYQCQGCPAKLDFGNIVPGAEESKMRFARSGQETRYSNSHFWNRSRIKKDLFKFSLSGRESRILTIKNPSQDEIKIF